MSRSMPLPSKVNFLTFDVYGTLIDWETGIWLAFKREASRDGFTLEDPEEVLPRFHEYQREIQSGSYELYAEGLRRGAPRGAEGPRPPPPPPPARLLPAPPPPRGPLQGAHPPPPKGGPEEPPRPAPPTPR